MLRRSRSCLHLQPTVRGLLLSLVSVLVPGAPALAALDAYELFERTAAVYRELDSYVDQGELVVIEAAGRGATTKRYQFTIAAERAGAFLFRLEETAPGATRHAVWRRDGAIWHSTGGVTRQSPSATSALSRILGLQAMPVFLVPMLLLDTADGTPQPEAAALDGAESCDGGTCDVLVLSLHGGLSLARLWIDRETRLVRRLEVDLLPLPGARSETNRVQTTLSLDHESVSVDTALPAEAFSTAEIATPADNAPLQADSDLIVRDEISVELRSVPVRVLDRLGRPIRGLGASDFEVRVGNVPIPVVAVDWIPAGGRAPESRYDISPTPPAPLTPREEIDGNLIVFFIQADLNAVRTKGHLRILPFVREFLAALEPQDWAAVVSFDSHLKLWHDFSRDRRTVGDMIEQAVRFGGKPLLPLQGAPALARSFPGDEAKRAARPEKALHLTARSLFDIPGEKVIVYLGWGLGRFGGSGFSTTPDYDRAVAALKAARASVFVLDVTDADYHTLELGIRQVALDTGGTYAKTNQFARREVLRLTESISGYYVLTLDRDSLPEKRQKLRIRLRNLHGDVLLRDHRLYR